MKDDISVRQLLVESVVIAIAGGVTGVALSLVWIRALTTLIPRDTLSHWMMPTIDRGVLLTL
jgi:ABC-type antimicrobial peptide transport system permease subunit